MVDGWQLMDKIEKLFLSTISSSFYQLFLFLTHLQTRQGWRFSVAVIEFLRYPTEESQHSVSV